MKTPYYCTRSFPYTAGRLFTVWGTRKPIISIDYLLFKLGSMSPNCIPNILSTAVLSVYHSNTSSENYDFFQYTQTHSLALATN